MFGAAVAAVGNPYSLLLDLIRKNNCVQPVQQSPVQDNSIKNNFVLKEPEKFLVVKPNGETVTQSWSYGFEIALWMTAEEANKVNDEFQKEGFPAKYLIDTEAKLIYQEHDQDFYHSERIAKRAKSYQKFKEKQ